MKRLLSLLLLLLAYALSSYAASDPWSINIDFGTSRQTPQPAYAAAAPLSGYWNRYSSLRAGESVESLADNSGAVTADTVNVSFSFSKAVSDVNPGAQPFSKEDQPLLGDYLCTGTSTMTLAVAGLPEGTYTFYVYMVGRQDYPKASEVAIATSNSAPQPKSISGVWSEQYVEGESYARIKVEVSHADTVQIFLNVRNDDAFISGLQIVAGEATPAALSHYLGDDNALEWSLDNSFDWSYHDDQWQFPDGRSMAIPTLSPESSTTLTATVSESGHLEFWWSLEHPQALDAPSTPEAPATTMALLVNGEEYLSFDPNTLYEPGRFQLFVEAGSTISWQIVNELSESIELGFELGSVSLEQTDINEAPIINTSPFRAPPMSATVGEYFYTYVTVSDPDGDTCVLRAEGMPAYFSFTCDADGQGDLRASSPYYKDRGVHEIQISANDGVLSSSETVPLAIESPYAPGVIRQPEKELDLIPVLAGTDFTSENHFFSETGNLIVIPYAPGDSIRELSIYEYRVLEDSSLELVTSFTEDNLPAGCQFGGRGYCDGDRLFLGVGHNDRNSPQGLPFMAVYERQEDGSWALVQTLISSEGYYYLGSGNIPIAIHDNWLAVIYRHYVTEMSAWRDALELYAYGDGEGWTLQQSITSVGGFDNLGSTLAFYGNKLAVGAPMQENGDGTAINDGAVYIYELSDEGVWNLDGGLLPPDPYTSYPTSAFGKYVAYSDGQLIVSNPYWNAHGRMYIYDIPPVGLPVLRQQLYGGGQPLIAQDGWMFTTYRYSTLANRYAGSVSAYRHDSDGDWTLASILLREDAEPQSYYGSDGLAYFGGTLYVTTDNDVSVFTFNAFEDWYMQKYGYLPTDHDAALWADADNNGQADILDYENGKKARLSAPTASSDKGRVSIAGVDYATVAVNPDNNTPGLSWQVQRSFNLEDWDDTGMVLLRKEENEIWGIPWDDNRQFFSASSCNLL
ncbi:hypothetical protein H5P28_14575 [Ruficoccus amylovorans]|uniref:Uncharacterized protein n=1 Tax=Ruficoccus amylovorans TaxID=1804625 RepID=A0A842HGQ4_9BACT|nr:hypothetical protein [Ruficoccus amylovorans]MBC2595489.1 hypothetical protein [Ruficoccus amylovorans]